VELTVRGVQDRYEPGRISQGVEMIADNLFRNIPCELRDEQIITLLQAPNVRIERIVSTGHATAPDQWCDQDQAEWVLVLAGSAGLVFEGETEPRLLEAGSYVHIAAHVRHRVAWTDASTPTVWLAIHYHPAQGAVADTGG
jgi:cupin 2 domain-containing protein